MTNCLFYAWTLWRYREFDWFSARMSRYGWFLHFAVFIEQPDGSMVKKEFVPTAPTRRWLPPLRFEGEYRMTRYIKDEK